MTKNKRNRNDDGNKKKFFLDTSALMMNSMTVFSLASCPVPKEILKDEKTKFYSLVQELGSEIKKGEPNDIYISTMVEWELNNIKDNDRKDFMQRAAARNALHVLMRIKEYGAEKNQSMYNGITLPNGSKIYLIHHNEKEFLEKKTDLYEPNRDDRIIFDYTNFIDNTLLRHVRKTNAPKKIIPIELVTEDYNFRGKTIDELAKSDIKAKCNPLLSERTESPNPGRKYTGVYGSALRIHNKNYEELINAKEYILSYEDLIKLTINGTALDSDRIDSMYPNTFIEIMPETPGKFEEENYYLKKLDSGFSIINNYNEFMKKEYDSKESEETSTSLDLNKIHNEELIRQMINRTSLSKQDKKSLKKKLRTRNGVGEIFETIKNNLSAEELQKYLSRDTEALSGAVQGSLLKKNLHPEILPIDEQKAYTELLMDPNIGLISFVAPQGAGKTYFSLAAAYSLIKQGKYEKIVYLKPMTTTGEGIGFLPGSEEKKTAPFMQSCYDSIEKMLGMDENKEFYEKYPYMQTLPGVDIVKELRSQKILETEIITYIAGRTINNAFIVFDEAQLLNREQMKLMIGRIGDTSKLVLIGDFAQLAAANAESRRKYDIITPGNAGLSHIIEALNGPKGKKCPYRSIYGHLSINREFTKRSQVAAISEYI